MQSLFDQSKLAPTGIKVNRDYYLMGEYFIKNLLITSLPDNFGLGMLSFYCSNQTVKLLMTTEPTRMDIHKALKNELQQKRQAYRKSKDDVVRERLSKEIISLEAYITEFVNSGDRSHNVVMVYSVRAMSLEELNNLSRELKSQLQTEGFQTVTLQYMQLELMKFASPIFADDELPDVMKRNYGAVTTSTSVAGFYPYTFQTLKDPGGFVYAREKNQAGIVLLNPMLYRTHPSLARLDGRLSGNIVVVGVTGTGKTTDMGLIIRHAIRQHMRIVWIDPEDKNMILAMKHGGNSIRWGQRGSSINMFDLKPVSSDENESLDEYDTELAIYNVIDEVKNILRLYKPSILEDSLDLIGPIIIKMYERKNINFNRQFAYLTSQDYPILSDFNDQISLTIEELKADDTMEHQRSLLRDLQAKISPMLTEHKYYFNGHTSINMSETGSQILAFGTKALYSKSRELRDAMNYIMFRFAWSLCLDKRIDSLLAIDEAHLMMLEGLSAQEIAVFYRRSRKYNNCCLIGTQETEDMASDVMVNGVAVSVHGKAIFNNSTYKIIKKLNKNGIECLARLMTVNDSQKEMIESFEMGDSLFCYGDRHMITSTIATTKELNEFELMREV